MLFEFAEDLLIECFNALHWSETHQKQWLELQPEIERHHIMRFLQALMTNAEVIGVERTARLTASILQLLQSVPPDQTITKEQIAALFEVK
jgi:hypothetical protein